MIPKRFGDREYICGKCGNKVGYYMITGSGENDWGYHKDNFCQSCGEKVDWFKSTEGLFTIYVMLRYKCGHLRFVRERVVLHPEEYDVTVSSTQCREIPKDCPMCETKYKMDMAIEEYHRNKNIYQKYKEIQERGENFFTTVSDKMREAIFDRMKYEDKE